MLPFVADMHMHTLVSGHAYGTIREMASAAAQAGLRCIGITEHAPGIPGTVEPIYYRNLDAVPRVLFGVEIYHGSEINLLPGGGLSLEQRYLDCLDYGIVGIHSPCYPSRGTEQNTRDLICAMENPKIRLVSHPDDSRTPLDYRLLVLAARELGVALEVNNSSLLPGSFRQNARENYKVMLALCRQYDVPVIVDSDAHDPSAVGRTDCARQLLRELQFPRELILSADYDRLRAFLGLPQIP